MNTKSIVVNTSKLSLDKPWVGISWKILSCLFFAINNSIIKYLTGSSKIGGVPLDTNSIALYQHLIAILALLLFMQASGEKIGNLIPDDNKKSYILRGLGFVAGTYLWIFSFKYASLTQVVLISGLVGHLITVITSMIFLKERLTFNRIILILATIFITYWVIPEEKKAQLVANELLGWTIFIPGLAILCFTIVKIITKKIMKNINNGNNSINKISLSALSIHFYIFILPFNFAIAGFKFPEITTNQGILLILLGFCTAGANYTLNKAIQYSDLIILVPVSKIKTLFNFLIDVILFKEFFAK